jgi:DNA gyrase subunit A
MSVYATKTNRRKLIGAYSDKSPVAAIAYIREDCEFLLTSSQGKILLFHSGAIQSKTTRSTQGVAVMTLRKGSRVLKAERYAEDMLKNPNRYRKNIPAAGSLPAADETEAEQLKL